MTEPLIDKGINPEARKNRQNHRTLPDTTSPKLFQEGTIWVKERLNFRRFDDCFWDIGIYRQGRKRAEKLVDTVDQAAGNLNIVSVNFEYILCGQYGFNPLFGLQFTR